MTDAHQQARRLPLAATLGFATLEPRAPELRLLHQDRLFGWLEHRVEPPQDTHGQNDVPILAADEKIPQDVIRAWTDPGLADVRIRRDLLKYARTKFDKNQLERATTRLADFGGDVLVLWSRNRVMPVFVSSSNLVAKLPSVITILGRINPIWRSSHGLHVSISSGSGSRFPGGRHFTTFAM